MHNLIYIYIYIYIHKEFYSSYVFVCCSKISYYNSTMICILNFVWRGHIIVISYCKKVWHREKESVISVCAVCLPCMKLRLRHSLGHYIIADFEIELVQITVTHCCIWCTAIPCQLLRLRPWKWMGLIKPRLTFSRLMKYIYMSYRTANLQIFHFIYLFNKYTYWIF